MTHSRAEVRFFSPFNALSSEYLDKVIEKAQLRELPKGKIIFKRGKTLEENYYLLEGCVDLIDAQFEKQALEAGSEASRNPLNNGMPTQVSALAKTSVKLMCLERDFVDLILVWSQSGEVVEHDHPAAPPPADEHDWMSYLLEAPLFSRVPPSNIQKLFVRFESVEFDAGSWVIREGEPGDFFYVLERGRAQVLNKAGQPLAEIGPGDYFGEEALVGETTRNAGVRMLTEGSLMRLEKQDFSELLQEPVMRSIDTQEVQLLREKGRPVEMLDVRLPLERRMGFIAKSRSIPLAKLRESLPELNREHLYIVSDDAGRRACVAVQLLLQAGLDALVLNQSEALHETDSPA